MHTYILWCSPAGKTIINMALQTQLSHLFSSARQPALSIVFQIQVHATQMPKKRIPAVRYAFALLDYANRHSIRERSELQSPLYSAPGFAYLQGC